MKLKLALAILVLATAVSATGEDYSYKAKELRKSDVWINGAPLTLKALRGKVVVIDFWAFDCEPCIEAMPQINDLYAKYGNAGLVVIGVHTPRADYEHDVAKLRQAISRMGIKFPVVVDDNQKMFRDYLCDLWPTQFVIDPNGIVRYSHGGLGRYSEMERVVSELLKK
jgi:thiol-disulfide isomerase/thioredoxin